MAKKNLIANVIAFLILALLISWVYRFQMRNYNNLSIQKEDQIKKNEVIDSISGLEKRMLTYKGLLYKKEMNAVVNTINEIAGKNKVKINSIEPLSAQDAPYYIQLSLNLEVSMGSYHVLGAFISNLEKSPEVFSIDAIEVSSRGASSEQGIKELNANLKISTFIYKE